MPPCQHLLLFEMTLGSPTPNGAGGYDTGPMGYPCNHAKLEQQLRTKWHQTVLPGQLSRALNKHTQPFIKLYIFMETRELAELLWLSSFLFSSTYLLKHQERNQLILCTLSLFKVETICLIKAFACTTELFGSI